MQLSEETRNYLVTIILGVYNNCQISAVTELECYTWIIKTLYDDLNYKNDELSKIIEFSKKCSSNLSILIQSCFYNIPSTNERKYVAEKLYSFCDIGINSIRDERNSVFHTMRVTLVTLHMDGIIK